jgi:hypothetical protein
MRPGHATGRVRPGAYYWDSRVEAAKDTLERISRDTELYDAELEKDKEFQQIMKEKKRRAETL